MITRWLYDFDPVVSDFTRLSQELDQLFDIGLPQGKHPQRAARNVSPG